MVNRFRIMSAKSIPPAISVWSKQSFDLAVLLLGWLIVNYVLYVHLGLKVVNDSARYLEYAGSLRKGFSFDPHNFWYFTYVLFIYLIKFISANNFVIIIAQCALSLIGTAALYRTSLNLFNDRKSALITALLYICFTEIQAWNFYVLPESLYASLLCITFYLISRAKDGIFQYIPEILAVLIAFLTKPSGISILLAYIFYTGFKNRSTIETRYRTIVVISAFAITTYFLINRMLHTFILIENYQKGEIVYGITTLPNYPFYDQLILLPAETLYIPDVQAAPLIRLSSFIIHNPLFFTKLFLIKVFYNVMNVRPYWSYWHNIFSASFLCIVYYFFVRGLKLMKETPFGLLLGSYIGIQLIILGLTTVDWDGRFLVPLLPVIFLISGRSIAHFVFRDRVVIQ